MRVEGLSSFAEDAGTTMFQLISNGLKDPRGPFQLDEALEALATSVSKPVLVSERVSAMAGASGSSVVPTKASSSRLFDEVTLAKAQIFGNMRAAMAYQSALLAPELMDRLVSHLSASGGPGQRSQSTGLSGSVSGA